MSRLIVRSVCVRQCIAILSRLSLTLSSPFSQTETVGGETNRKALLDALDQVVTVNIESRALVDAYTRVAAACRAFPSGDRVMGNNDMWIAATALVSGQALITTDKDFNHLNGSLITVHWVDPVIGKPTTS